MYSSLYAGDPVLDGPSDAQRVAALRPCHESVDGDHREAHPIVRTFCRCHAPGIKNAVVWNTLSPRAGLAYAVGKDRKTVARASYSAFASQLPAPAAGNISAASYAYAYYLAVDANHNYNIEPTEFRSFLFAKNIIRTNPSRRSTRSVPTTARHERMRSWPGGSRAVSELRGVGISTRGAGT